MTKDTMRVALAVLVLAAGGLAAAVQRGVAQQGGWGASTPYNPTGTYSPANKNSRDAADPTSPGSAALHERIEKGRETDRQRRMIADTNHLLALATELKVDVDKTVSDKAPGDSSRKAEEIEKLAHSVKERMRN